MIVTVTMNILPVVYDFKTFNLLSIDRLGGILLPITAFIQYGVKLQSKRLLRVHEENIAHITEICILIFYL